MMLRRNLQRAIGRWSRRAVTQATLTALVALAVSSPQRARATGYWALPALWDAPDAVTAADSARGVALVTCLRSGSYTKPALLRTDRLLGGKIPRKFTAFPPGSVEDARYFRTGARFVVLLRAPSPPIGPQFRRVFPWRHAAQFDVWHCRWVPSQLSDSVADKLYRAVWRMPRMSHGERIQTLADWIRARETESWAGEVLSLHHDIWGDPIRDAFMARLRLGDDRDREWAAEELAQHPDTVTRAKFVRLCHADTSTRWLAALLGSRDRTVWVRHLLLNDIAHTTLTWDPGPCPSGTRPELRFNLNDGIDRGLPASGPEIKHKILSALVNAMDPDSSEAERLVLILIAQWARPADGLRYEALERIGTDTAQVVRDLVWQTIRLAIWRDAPDPSFAARYWMPGELMRALQDSTASVRELACQEVSRREDGAAADTLLRWLRRGRFPDGTDMSKYDVAMMLRAVSGAHRPGELADLMAWDQSQDDVIRQAMIVALDHNGDPRSAPLLRQYAARPCSEIDQSMLLRLASALSHLGNLADTATFIRWIREGCGSREWALQAVGVLAGPAAMVRVIRETEPMPMTPQRALGYERLEANLPFWASSKRWDAP